MSSKPMGLLCGISLLLSTNTINAQTQNTQTEDGEDNTSFTLNFYSEVLLSTYFGNKNIDKETFHQWVDTVLPSCSPIVKCHTGDIKQCSQNKESMENSKLIFTEMHKSLETHNTKSKADMGNYSGQAWEKSLTHPIEVARMQLNDMCEYSQVEGGDTTQVSFAPEGTERILTLDSNMEGFIFNDTSLETAFLNKLGNCDSLKESEYQTIAKTIVWNSIQQKNKSINEITTSKIPSDLSFDFKETKSASVKANGKAFQVVIPPFSHFMTYISKFKKINNNCKINTQNAVFNLFFPNLVNEHFMLREFLAPFENVQGLQEAILTSLSDEEDITKKTSKTDLQHFLNTMPPLKDLFNNYVFLDVWEQERGIFEVSGMSLFNVVDLPKIKGRIKFHFESFWNGVHISFTELEDAQGDSLFEAFPLPPEIKSQFYNKLDAKLQSQKNNLRYKIEEVKEDGAIYITIQQKEGQDFHTQGVQSFLDMLGLEPVPQSEL